MAKPQANLPPSSVEDALRAVRERVGKHLADGVDGSDFDGIHVHVRLLCHLARRDGIPPERVIIELKHTLVELQGLHALTPVERDELHSKVVEYAIREYFANGD